jgi:CRISPR-associated endonuclease/helicase Cas3
MGDQPNGLLLPGLDGGNPLGFLTALGVLMTLEQSEAQCPVKLLWNCKHGNWVPVVYPPTKMDSTEIIRALQSTFCTQKKNHPALRWQDFHSDKADVVRNVICDNPDAWSACIGIEPLSNTDKSKRISQLQAARKDYHVKAIANLLDIDLSEDQLRKTLLQSWDYGEPLEGLTLHIDPSEDRRHAFQWNQPAGDPNRKAHGNMIAANRIALEAYPLFPTVQVGDVGQTIGFRGRRKDNTFWTWPIWSGAANADVIRSLLASPELQKEQPDRRKLRAMGIEAVMRSQRILVGKTPNFAPARQIA